MDVSEILDPLNDSQREAVCAPSGNLMILAGAGSGKTRVLVHRISWYIATNECSSFGILAVTFTNKAAAEMRGRIEELLQTPSGGMWVGTFHGIAHRLLRAHWQEANLPQSFQILDSDDQLRLVKRVVRGLELDESQYNPREAQWFINSRKDDGLRPEQIDTSGDPTLMQMVRIYSSYQEACETSGLVDFAELLLRAFELFRDNPSVIQHYQQRFRHILVDEFQDTNSLQYAWLKLLVGPNGHLFAVGDDDQCLDAGAMVSLPDGKKLPIEHIDVGDAVMSSYGSGDYRPAIVTDTFVREREGQRVILNFASGNSLSSTPEHTHFAGYLLDHTPQMHFLYLMYKQGVGFRLGTSQVYTKGQKKPVLGFKQRALHERADALWIIRTHNTENEARLDETLTSLKYSLPTMPFVPRKGRGTAGIVHDQALIGKIFAELDTRTSAQQLLQDVNLDERYPHHVPQGRNSIRHNITVTLCGDRRGRNPMHRISLIGTSEALRQQLIDAGFSIRAAKKASRSWRFETCRKDFYELMKIAKDLRDLCDARIVLNGNIQGRSLPFIKAAHIRPGMVMVNEQGEFDVVTSVQQEASKDKVYDINVLNTHNFIANGVVTHNSVYSWRGARVDNMLRFEKDFANSKLLRLEQNYRSTAKILKAANELIGNNSGRLGKELWTDGEQGENIQLYTAFNEQDEARFVINQIESGQTSGKNYEDMAILYRVSAQSRVFEEQLMQQGIPYRVYGGMRFYERQEIKDALAYLRLATFPDDDASFERIVNTPTRGIGQKTLQDLRLQAREQSQPLWHASAYLIQHKLLSSRACSALENFLVLMRKISEATKDKRLEEAMDVTIRMSGLIEHFKKEKGEKGEARIENLEELVRGAGSFTVQEDIHGDLEPLQAFLAHAALESGDTQANANTKCVNLMTLHAAKGLEFPEVYLVGMEEGLFPHQRSSDDIVQMEEERRLCYVGITRAQKKLILTHAQHRRMHGSDYYPQASRFVNEIPKDLIDEVRLGGAVSHQQFSRSSVSNNFKSATTEVAGGFRLGQRVSHQRFGEGTVLRLEGQGAQARIQVNFEEVGSKWLVLAYANLSAA